ncbi:MAG: TonB-dependent receptor [Pseudomonadota bacterium]
MTTLIFTSTLFANDTPEQEDDTAEVISDADTVVLDNLLVTATSPDGTSNTLPNSVLIIPSEKIKNSGATTLVDVLKGEANMNLQAFTETGKNSSIDIRGMGATAPSNVLLMVDGQRINNNDLSGADYTSIPLETIEKIEVIRGGGSVRYGDGAVGGVINVITKTPEENGLHGELYARVGEFNTQDNRSYFSYANGSVDMTAALSRYHTDGFRDNGDLKRRSAFGQINYELFTGINVFGRASILEDEGGLPGPISREAYEGTWRQRQSTNFPNDESETNEQLYNIGIEIVTEDSGTLVLETGYRDRDNPFTIGFSPLIPIEDQSNKINVDTITASARYELPFELADYSHRFFAGFEWEDTDYLRTQNGTDVVGTSARREGEVHRGAGYFETVLNGPHSISLTSGYRLERFSTSQADQTLGEDCDTILVFVNPPGIFVPTQVNCVAKFETSDSNKNVWYNHAANLGVVWEPTDWLTLYASISRNFRSPNIDELLFASQNLVPQKGISKDLGMRIRNFNNLDVSLSVFSLQIKDEIVFAEDPILATSVNRNLDSKTERIGLELDIIYEPVSSLVLSGNLGYVRARLKDEDADIPLVPRITAAADANLSLSDRASINLDVIHVSERIDGNDFGTSNYPVLEPYTVVNLNGRYEFSYFELFAGVQNLTNEVYSTIAYSSTYYPMPERNGFIGLRSSF